MHVGMVLAGALPALIAMYYVDRLDAARPEPRWSLRKVAIAGGLAIIPCVILELLLARVGPAAGWPKVLFTAFIVAGAVEELAKLLCLRWFIWHAPELDERMDGIVYASRAGLGFALVENVLYLLQEHTLGGQLQLWVMRAALAVPGHAMWTGMIGAMAARRRFDRKGLGLIAGYLLAVAFHGAYDMCVFLQQPLHFEGYETLTKLVMPAIIGLTVLAFFVLRSMAKKALQLDDIDAAKLPAPV